MRSPRLLAMAAVLFSGVAVPAFAAWDHIGTIDVSSRPNDHDVQYGNFGGRVEALSLQARESDVVCRDVTATFGNGQTRQIFRGMLQRGRNVAVDLPGESRLVRRIDFDCRALRPMGGRVDIAADIGRYQAEWRRSPDWDRMWSRIFPWANDRDRDYDRFGRDRYVTGQLDTSGWFPVGTERFEGGYDHEMTFTGVRGRSLDAIALRPLNDDARCNNIQITFGNGSVANLNILGGILREGRIKTLDLPGNRQDVSRIDMVCRAEHGNMVTMQVLASR